MGKHEWIVKLVLALIAVAGRILLRLIDRHENRKDAAAQVEREQEFLSELEETLHPNHKSKGAKAGK